MSSLPSPDQSNRPPFWFILLLVLGVPISWLTAVKIIQQPWLVAVIVLSYFGIVIVTGILAGVWQELKNQWVKKIVDWINGPHDYQKRYCRWLIIQHNQFDVGGLDTYGTSLPTLEQIFVELNLVERPPIKSLPLSLKLQKHLSRPSILFPILLNRKNISCCSAYLVVVRLLS